MFAVTSFPYEVRLRIESVCVSGSSNTTLLVDVATGDVLAEAKGRDEEQEAAAVEFGE